MKRVALSLLILTICATSKASVLFVEGGATGVGDGGTGVVCSARSGLETYELLDLYEANKLYGLEIPFAPGDRDLAPDSTSYQDEIERLQIAFESVTGDQTFSSNFVLAAHLSISLRNGLATSFDVNPLTIPLEPNCELRQIGFRHSGFARTPVEIDAVAWRRFDLRRRALLVIHEALHDRFPTSFEGAEALRQVVAYIAAPVDFQIANRALIRQVIRTGQPASDRAFRK